MLGVYPMSGWKSALAEQGAKLLGNPKVLKLLQDERVMKTVVQLAGVPAKVQSFTQDQVGRLVKSLDLATEEEVRDLRRNLRRVEDDLARLEAEKRRDLEKRAHEEAQARRQKP